MRIGSLFSGIGGLEYGLELAQLGEVAWQVEIDPGCNEVLAHHWRGIPQFRDVTDPTLLERLDDVDLICGGFPCQGASNAGKRQGMSDPRTGLWRYFAKIVKYKKPKFVVIENVAGLRTRGLDQVYADLTRLGYFVETSVIRAADVGAPHLRARLFIVAIRQPRIAPPHSESWRPLDATLTLGKMKSQGLDRQAEWPTPTVCGNYNRTGASDRSGDGLATAVRAWPTPTASAYGTNRGGGAGRVGEPRPSLAGAVTENWATPVASLPLQGKTDARERKNGKTLNVQVHEADNWATPIARDHRGSWAGSAATGRTLATRPLSEQVGESSQVLNPDWVECLMGFPVGWTSGMPTFAPKTGVRKGFTWAPPQTLPFPASRGQVQHDFEPPRTIPSRRRGTNRAARLKALGNAVVPQCARLAGLRIAEWIVEAAARAAG